MSLLEIRPWASQFLRGWREIKVLPHSDKGDTRGLLALLSPHLNSLSLLINLPEKEIKAMRTIMKSKLKMFAVTHPTYRNHKNKLNQ